VSQVLPHRLDTPVLDDIQEELGAVASGVESAQRHLAKHQGRDAALALAITHEILFSRLPARWWMLTLFDAARRKGAVGPLAALREGLEEVETRLLAAEAALDAADFANASTLLSGLRGTIAFSYQQASELLEGPLGQQMRMYALEGLLD
jgi:hypothetical protein